MSLFLNLSIVLAWFSFNCRNSLFSTLSSSLSARHSSSCSSSSLILFAWGSSPPSVDDSLRRFWVGGKDIRSVGLAGDSEFQSVGIDVDCRLGPASIIVVLLCCVRMWTLRLSARWKGLLREASSARLHPLTGQKSWRPEWTAWTCRSRSTLEPNPSKHPDTEHLCGRSCLRWICFLEE